MLCAIVIQFIFGVAVGAFAYYMPLFFQVVRNSSAMLSGLPLIPMQLATISTVLIVGWLVSRTGFNKVPLVVGTILSTTLYGLVQFFDADTPWSQVYGTVLVGGIGNGCISALVVVTAQSTLKDERDTAVATGLLSYIVMMGVGVGIPAASAMLNAMLIQELPKYVPMDYVAKVFNSPEYIHDGLPSQYVDGAIQAYVSAFRSLWCMMMGLAAITFISALLIKGWALRTHNSNEESNATV
ncbi:hypothetical protein LRAMOSA08215 [Lichtheimia ramosa]|uniref:Major facilitator superfamily (MFS) profile domain-containing protein n=1 Tax=Lichtheimia ramosa TaxID=688394 RepID=A0A077WG82_9FUNG|nr:hypothetical protein LRAMOSA08215 [Lichtheimia ramosa]